MFVCVVCRLTSILSFRANQVHADASTFADGVSKEDALRQVLEQAEGLCEGQRNWVCGLFSFIRSCRSRSSWCHLSWCRARIGLPQERGSSVGLHGLEDGDETT